MWYTQGSRTHPKALFLPPSHTTFHQVFQLTYEFLEARYHVLIIILFPKPIQSWAHKKYLNKMQCSCCTFSATLKEVAPGSIPPHLREQYCSLPLPSIAEATLFTPIWVLRALEHKVGWTVLHTPSPNLLFYSCGNCTQESCSFR